MNKMEKIGIAFLCLLFSLISAGTDTLQQDLNGYSGCIDAYVNAEYKTQNYGTLASITFTRTG